MEVFIKYLYLNRKSNNWHQILALSSTAVDIQKSEVSFLITKNDYQPYPTHPTGDGLIQHRELAHVMRACMEENGMQFSDEQLLHLTSAMFEDADAEKRGAITYEALKKQLGNHEGLLENLSIR